MIDLNSARIDTVKERNPDYFKLILPKFSAITMEMTKVKKQPMLSSSVLKDKVFIKYILGDLSPLLYRTVGVTEHSGKGSESGLELQSQLHLMLERDQKDSRLFVFVKSLFLLEL